MSDLTNAALRIRDALPTSGGQALVDAERDLRALLDACGVMVRRDIDGATAEDAALIKDILGTIDDRRDEWSEAITIQIAETHPESPLEWLHGVDAAVMMIDLEMPNLEHADLVKVVIAGVETSVPPANVVLDGETLNIEDAAGETLLDLPLRDLAAFGFAEGMGRELNPFDKPEWSGFDLLTMDGRFITLR